MPWNRIVKFYNILEQNFSKVEKKMKFLFLGDFTAKRSLKLLSHSAWSLYLIGHYDLNETKESFHQLLNFCLISKLTIANTTFKHKEKRRLTWISPEDKAFHQIDYAYHKSSRMELQYQKYGALRDLVQFVQFKKHEKHPWRSVTFSQSATLLKVTLLHGCFSRF